MKFHKKQKNDVQEIKRESSLYDSYTIVDYIEGISFFIRA